jgi:UDP-N-acetylglucosamine--N-acetylmuramyl-(pentapeptide) pyrophosphoryl-undecaprenol N-acetylglucosamine transferase
MTSENKINILFAGGGTGGHLFPAMAVAEKMQEIEPRINPIFIGTENRIESRKVPEAGYEYYSMPVEGFPGLNSRAIKWPMSFHKSYQIAKKIIKQKNIKALVCAGAYISVPPGLAASRTRTPIFLMESNFNLGKANKFLVSRAKNIFITYNDTLKYLQESQKSKVIISGNPVRNEILNLANKDQALKKFGLNPDKSTLLIIGGSLGARSINKVVSDNLEKFGKLENQIIWQTGSNFPVPTNIPKNVHIYEFIDDMASAYSASDSVVSRSGATACAEIIALAIPSILVPMPSASNNEQKLNAEFYDKQKATKIIYDEDLEQDFWSSLIWLLSDKVGRKSMSENCKKLGTQNASEIIAKHILVDIL